MESKQLMAKALGLSDAWCVSRITVSDKPRLVSVEVVLKSDRMLVMLGLAKKFTRSKWRALPIGGSDCHLTILSKPGKEIPHEPWMGRRGAPWAGPLDAKARALAGLAAPGNGAKALGLFGIPPGEAAKQGVEGGALTGAAGGSNRAGNAPSAKKAPVSALAPARQPVKEPEAPMPEAPKAPAKPAATLDEMSAALGSMLSEQDEALDLRAGQQSAPSLDEIAQSLRPEKPALAPLSAFTSSPPAPTEPISAPFAPVSALSKRLSPPAAEPLSLLSEPISIASRPELAALPIFNKRPVSEPSSEEGPLAETGAQIAPSDAFVEPSAADDSVSAETPASDALAAMSLAQMNLNLDADAARLDEPALDKPIEDAVPEAELSALIALGANEGVGGSAPVPEAFGILDDELLAEDSDAPAPRGPIGKADIPPREDIVWELIALGGRELDVQFLPLKLLMAKLQLKMEAGEKTSAEYANELHDFFIARHDRLHPEIEQLQ